MSYQYTADRFVACKAYSFDSAAGCVKQANSGDETSKLFRKVGATKHADTVCLTRCDAECFEEITCLPQSYHSPPTGRIFLSGKTATTQCGGDCSGCFELEPCGKCCQASRGSHGSDHTAVNGKCPKDVRSKVPTTGQGSHDHRSMVARPILSYSLRVIIIRAHAIV